MFNCECDRKLIQPSSELDLDALDNQQDLERVKETKWSKQLHMLFFDNYEQERKERTERQTDKLIKQNIRTTGETYQTDR